MSTRCFRIRGRNLTVKEMSALRGIASATIRHRLRSGWSPERAAYAALSPKHPLITFNGKTQTLQEWAKETGLNYFSLYDRINSLGWSVERALTAPLNPQGASRARRARIRQRTIKRMIEAFKSTIDHQRGAYPSTSPQSQGTGAGSTPHDLHGARA